MALSQTVLFRAVVRACFTALATECNVTFLALATEIAAGDDIEMIFGSRILG